MFIVVEYVYRCVHRSNSVQWQFKGRGTVPTGFSSTLVSETTRNSLRDLKIENFPGGACPQTPSLRNSTSSIIVVLANEKRYDSPCPPPLDKNPKWNPARYAYLCTHAGDSGDTFGAWSTEGCREIMREGNRRVCKCTQLAHFGILFVSDYPIMHTSMHSIMCCH